MGRMGSADTGGPWEIGHGFAIGCGLLTQAGCVEGFSPPLLSHRLRGGKGGT